jgi:hypothetical protein
MGLCGRQAVHAFQSGLGNAQNRLPKDFLFQNSKDPCGVAYTICVELIYPPEHHKSFEIVQLTAHPYGLGR